MLNNLKIKCECTVIQSAINGMIQPT